MKTPRLALFALLVLALAPVARATDRVMPTWPVIEEGSRAWPTVRFSAGNDRRSLQCRYKECNPATNKGQSNLFLLNKTGESTTTKVTIYIAVRRSKMNPRYYTDGPDEMVAQIIVAKANVYTSELSHYKLDNTGGKLTVVQGTTRYPATTDIDETQFNSYDQMKVLPPDPKKMVDDEIKPSAPPKTTYWCDQNTGEIVGVLPGQKAPAGYTPLASRSSTCGKKPSRSLPVPPTRTLAKLPTAGKWKDAITPVGEWRAVQTSAWPLLGVPVPTPALTFYCYHERMDGDKDLTTHLKKNPLIVECVNWSAPTDDATKEDAGKKYKVRNNLVQFDLAYRNGRLETLSGVKGTIVTEKAALPDALGGEKFVKVTAAQAPSADGATIALDSSDTGETRWLTKPQAATYKEKRAAAKDDAERKPLDIKYRGLVKDQVRPEAATAYASAIAAKPAEMPALITAAIGKLELWGGEVKAIVAPFQEKADPATAKLLEIQLSKADWDALQKKPDALKAYTNSRLSANGASGDGTAFDKNYLDPVALHLGVVEARKATGTGPVVAPKPDDEAIVELTPDELKLLTPAELQVYEKTFLKPAKDKVPGAAKLLKDEVARLRALIAAENRGKEPAYAVPGDLAAFNKLQEWQKRKFCSERIASTANLQADTRAPAIGGISTKAKGQLDESAAAATATGNQTTASATTGNWADDACKPYNTAPVVTTPGGKTPVTATVPTPIAADKENEAKKKSEWLTQDLLVSAAKGAMVGLLVGSLFGPIGLIAGPLIGAGLFYGLTKVMG
jgi:hypothetical protein